MLYLALLRGINVGGKTSVTMADLKKVCESLNYRNINTYLQSGNIIFETKTSDQSKVSEELEKALFDKLHVKVRIIVRTKEEMRQIIRENPHLKQKELNIDKMHVTFLYELKNTIDISRLADVKDPDELFVIRGREIYLYCPNGYGRTKINNQAFEKAFDTAATTRNWHTTSKLYEMMENR
jgi:uncharacterized protein (DUF1697 family)